MFSIQRMCPKPISQLYHTCFVCSNLIFISIIGQGGLLVVVVVVALLLLVWGLGRGLRRFAVAKLFWLALTHALGLVAGHEGGVRRWGCCVHMSRRLQQHRCRALRLRGSSQTAASAAIGRLLTIIAIIIIAIIIIIGDEAKASSRVAHCSCS